MIEAQTTESRLAETIRRVADEVETVIVGKRNVIDLAITGLLCNGHILIEDIPGVGKTTLAKALARSVGCDFKRIQFTPDLLPSDITGSTIFNQKTTQFEFREGPVFTHILLADEINRATPKTQSALLECMEEGQVTVDGTTYELPRPFFVIATQNNIESHGTYPLPEAEMDRFAIRLAMGYPEKGEEAQMLARQIKTHPLEFVKSVISRSELLALQQEVRDIFVDGTLREYIVDIVSSTRNHPLISLGSSPRGSLFLLHIAQAYAGMQGRTYVVPDDIKMLTKAALAHRILMHPEARLKRMTPESVVGIILDSVAVPVF